jgi:hypothetical protein
VIVVNVTMIENLQFSVNEYFVEGPIEEQTIH